ncbi:hypothetical protein [Micromonospora sp. ATA51]|uniref:hypothetical protein n=1 Tax=Micromonospora sp. ATA51 TaxID=2806098 RepID=UPI001EE49DE2|nr:hypothetical protein [Micromonospora sp. ATA51]
MPMHPYAIDVAAGTGADPTGFRARKLRPEHLTAATVVLTATRRQRSLCTALAPGALNRTFTLRQFARLAAAAEPPKDPAAGRCGRRSRRPPAPGGGCNPPPPTRTTA